MTSTAESPSSSSSSSSPPPPPPTKPQPTTSSSSSSPYPFAAAPDIIRAHQKDAYFTGLLANHLSDLHRRLLGARSAHAWAPTSRAAADALYLCLTTLLGNRTLGEEYCDLVQVHAPSSGSSKLSSSSSSSSSSLPGTPSLPALPRRAAYIATSVLLPHLASRLLPRLRALLRSLLESRLAALARRRQPPRSGPRSKQYRVARYLAAHLPTWTSGAPFHAVTLAVFYFTGAYYSLAKRLLRLRYVFTRHVDAEAGGRAGYEVLGVLLVFQLAVQGWMHVRAASAASAHSDEVATVEAAVRERVAAAAASSSPATVVDVSLDHEHSYAANNDLLLGTPSTSSYPTASTTHIDIAAATHTPVLDRPRYDLQAESTMRWIGGAQQRKCTLCLEPLRDPAATPCGHVFCWACIGDWVREKPECPLCRREALVQHVLPLRAA